MAPFIFTRIKCCKLNRVLNDPILCFPAADVLVLVPAAHVGEPPHRESFKRHRCSIVVTGKEIPGFMGEPLPAFEPERLVTQIKRTAMDEQHAAIHPFHGHTIKNGKKW
jgi:hypothetical protein